MSNVRRRLEGLRVRDRRAFGSLLLFDSAAFALIGVVMFFVYPEEPMSWLWCGVLEVGAVLLCREGRRLRQPSVLRSSGG